LFNVGTIANEADVSQGVKNNFSHAREGSGFSEVESGLNTW